MTTIQLNHPSFVVLSASPGSGKSHLIKYLAYSESVTKKINYIVVFCPTISDYGWMPNGFVYHQYSDEKLAKLLKKQKKFIEEGKQIKVMIIFDDCLGSVAFNSNLLTHFISCHRHYNATIMISTQSVNKVPPTVRESCQLAVIFKQNTTLNIKASFESYGARYFKNWGEWRDFMNKNCYNYSFITVDNKQQSNDPKLIYQIKSAPQQIPRFKLKF